MACAIDNRLKAPSFTSKKAAYSADIYVEHLLHRSLSPRTIDEHRPI